MSAERILVRARSADRRHRHDEEPRLQIAMQCIRPILAENCFACHGPDKKQRKAKLHFDTRDGAFSRPSVIVPGNTGKSLPIKWITKARTSVRKLLA